ncbi:HNH endonuclease (plasmid) [Frondihabitans sucicola]|uniref:HNH endonuclease n=1 Tax=Frondihabitans sucicola TaxID=1268041 RepID=A0ABM8GVG7_9MICO|nr:HNH endonuclease [Frondihabitans sucicola]BDZ52462.1 HNH endonuclease [Frondihabitans sucicola]
MSPVLVLNPADEPVGVVPIPRAVTYLLRNKATLVEEVDGATLHAAGFETPLPRVVRLVRYVYLPHMNEPQAWSRKALLIRDRYTCGYCGGFGNTVDHIVPTSRGGDPRSFINTVAACRACNGRKAALTPKEAGMRLLVTPRVPVGRESMRVVVEAFEKAHKGLLVAA